MTESIPLQKFLSNITQKGYTSTKVYIQESKVRFVQLYSNLQHKPFLLQVPNRFVIYSTGADHLLDYIENNYRNYRQREYLEKINLRDVACFSKDSLCVKNNNVYNCYLVDYTADSPELLRTTPVVSPRSLRGKHDESVDDDSSDIEIDDYPVEDIYPVFNMMIFVDNMDNFEDIVVKYYNIITTGEEENNENEVERLLQTFDNQKKILKDHIYRIHKEAYNTRRDISQTGSNLQRIYSLKEQSTEERDRVRFKIERLTIETEEKIDVLNNKLRDNRNQADSLLKKYWKFIEQFDLICQRN
uniref:Uncharacterized protein n=1 Tax=Marseillevirus LCMAC201 TaxID=2506605 RepID=A0A481YWJ9_9VIRU|nr:MAG: hypothetical protein LCMAC201_04090 [Marseillevirus LCMAC201]